LGDPSSKEGEKKKVFDPTGSSFRRESSLGEAGGKPKNSERGRRGRRSPNLGTMKKIVLFCKGREKFCSGDSSLERGL